MAKNWRNHFKGLECYPPHNADAFLSHNNIASFPDSTPQLFIHGVIKSWGVESVNEANRHLTTIADVVY